MTMHEGFKGPGQEALDLTVAPQGARIRRGTDLSRSRTDQLQPAENRSVPADEILAAMENHAGTPATEQIVRRRDGVW